MISYYELLGMIKEGKAPQRLRVHLTTSTSKTYVRDDDGDTFSHYEIENGYDEDDDYHFYLAEDFLESSMFDENIEILDEKNINDKARFQYSQIPSWFEKKELIKAINENFEKHQKAIYEIIDILNRKGE